MPSMKFVRYELRSESRLERFMVGLPPEAEQLWLETARDPDLHDPLRRLGNMDREGIAAEVIFHGTGPQRANGGLIPFERHSDLHLRAVGIRMYNRWLAEFCAYAPDRLIGVAETPIWDLELAVTEAEFAAQNGFCAINLPSPRYSAEPGSPTYDDPVWEPFWALVEDANMTLNCHTGAEAFNFATAGNSYRSLLWATGSAMSRAPLPMLIFGSVFERHPDLRLILNEQRGYWIAQTLRDFDSIYSNPMNRLFREELPLKPSEYWRRNCFVGGSFLARFELTDRDEIGINTITWGRDYPHPEGTWPYTAEALRATFAGLPTTETQMILGDNALRCYGLDGAALEPIAQKIGPLIDEVDRPLEKTPPDAWSYAFRDREDALGGQRFGIF